MLIKTVVILGMHSSGTSLTAKAFGQLMPMGAKGGLYEHGEIYHLNKDILTAAKGSDCWDNPPTEQEILALRSKFEGRIKEIVERGNKSAELQKSPHGRDCLAWGMKDPRLCITIPIIAPYLSNPQFVVNYRDHKEVAKSLMRREKRGDLVKWENLSKLYFNRAIRFLQ